jgi:hypothetical protein
VSSQGGELYDQGHLNAGQAAAINHRVLDSLPGWVGQAKPTSLYQRPLLSQGCVTPPTFVMPACVYCISRLPTASYVSLKN